MSTRGPAQRCFWYQVAKKSDVFVEQNDQAAAGFRQVIITTNTPVKARTPMSAAGVPAMLNAALYMPSVVNVYERTIFVRTDR